MDIKGLRINGVSPSAAKPAPAPKRADSSDDDAVRLKLSRARGGAAPNSALSSVATAPVAPKGGDGTVGDGGIVVDDG